MNIPSDGIPVDRAVRWWAELHPTSQATFLKKMFAALDKKHSNQPAQLAARLANIASALDGAPCATVRSNILMLAELLRAGEKREEVANA